MPKAGLNLSSCASASSCLAYTEMVNVVANDCNGSARLVVPGDIGASYLVNKLTGVGMCSGSRMPGGSYPDLTPAQLDVVRAWIGSGANP